MINTTPLDRTGEKRHIAKMTTTTATSRNKSPRARRRKISKSGHLSGGKSPYILKSKAMQTRVLKSSHFLRPNQSTQAGRVIARFGSAPALCRALENIGKPRDLTVVYRWDKPKNKGGTGGLIPAHNIPDILKAARHEGILLTDKDLSPMEQ